MIKLLLYGLIFFGPLLGGCQNAIEPSVLQALKSKLELISDRDQEYRTKSNVDEMYAAQYKYGINSIECQKIYHLITSHDSLNQQELIPILDKYGWLGKSQIGKKANEAIFYVLQHSNNAIRLKYIPLMRVSAAQGESNELHLQWLEDRILLEQGLPTKYHSQYYDVPRKDGTVDHYDNRAKANEELRIEGLDTITIAHTH
jgi:hypothetical protein